MSGGEDGTVSGAADWKAPGPGTWELDTTHFGPMTSRFMRDVMHQAVASGLGDAFELIGAPLRTMEAAFVNGACYLRQVPLLGGDRDLPTPPAAVLWAATRLHPTFRRRARRSEQAVAGRIWLDEHRRWVEEWKPWLVGENRRLARVAVVDLDDAALADHLEVVTAHAMRTNALHFRLHASDLGPIGLLLTSGVRWGLDPADVMAALAGASEATSAPATALAELRDELDRTNASPTTLDDVRACSVQAAQLLDAYLDEYGARLTTGYDIRDFTLAELPDVVMASITAERQVDGRSTHDEAVRRGDEALALLLDEAPADRRDELSRLVDDARLMYGLRDENGPLTSQWPGGVVRMAVLEVAARLLARGGLHDGEHVFDASATEMSALVRGQSGPGPDELAGRHDVRCSWVSSTPPAVLGRPAAPPPVHVLPGRMREMMEAVISVTTLLDVEPGSAPHHGSGAGDGSAGGGSEAATDVLRGTGVGSHAVVAVARVVTTADDALDRVEPGDIVVTRLTVPTFNAVLAMAGGVVTEHGGLLCHTAVIARELGLPAVVGVTGALTTIPDGATIELDPTFGTVRIVSSPFVS